MDDEEPRFELIWTASAIADLETVCSFIAVHDPKAAERVGRGLLEHVELLARFPFIGPAYPLGSGGPVREIVFRRTYRLFYAVTEPERVVNICGSGTARVASPSSRPEPPFECGDHRGFTDPEATKHGGNTPFAGVIP